MAQQGQWKAPWKSKGKTVLCIANVVWEEGRPNYLLKALCEELKK